MQSINQHLKERISDLEALKSYPAIVKHEEIDKIKSHFKSCEDKLGLLRLKLMEQEAIFAIGTGEDAKGDATQGTAASDDDDSKGRSAKNEKEAATRKSPAEDYLAQLDEFNQRLEHMLSNIPPKMPKVTDIHQVIEQERLNRHYVLS